MYIFLFFVFFFYTWIKRRILCHKDWCLRKSNQICLDIYKSIRGKKGI